MGGSSNFDSNCSTLLHLTPATPVLQLSLALTRQALEQKGAMNYFAMSRHKAYQRLPKTFCYGPYSSE